MIENIKKHTRENICNIFRKYIGGWGEGPYREIVSFRSCVRTRGVHCLVGMNPKSDTLPFSLVPLSAGDFPFSLEIESEIKVNSLRNPM